MLARFDRDTALDEFQPGRFRGTIDRGWWIERGPNGGYLAALVLRALTMTVGDPARTPRSLTIHYLAPPAEGPIEIATRLERTGRQLSFVSGRMRQGDRLIVTAQAAFALPLSGPEFTDIAPPEVPGPHLIEPSPMSGPPVPLRERYEMRWAIGEPPFSRAPRAVVGGWIRLSDPRPVDHLLLAAVTDAWLPPVFTRLDQRLGVPTVDLTVHFRAPLERAAMEPTDWFLVVFRTQVAADGFIEEDGEVWSPNGVLLAHSRQLAVLLA